MNDDYLDQMTRSATEKLAEDLARGLAKELAQAVEDAVSTAAAKSFDDIRDELSERAQVIGSSSKGLKETLDRAEEQIPRRVTDALGAGLNETLLTSIDARIKSSLAAGAKQQNQQLRTLLSSSANETRSQLVARIDRLAAEVAEHAHESARQASQTSAALMGHEQQVSSDLQARLDRLEASAITTRQALSRKLVLLSWQAGALLLLSVGMGVLIYLVWAGYYGYG